MAFKKGVRDMRGDLDPAVAAYLDRDTSLINVRGRSSLSIGEESRRDTIRRLASCW